MPLGADARGVCRNRHAEPPARDGPAVGRVLLRGDGTVLQARRQPGPHAVVRRVAPGGRAGRIARGCVIRAGRRTPATGPTPPAD